MKIVEEHEGARITHEFEEMTLEKRPQDHPRRDGRDCASKHPSTAASILT